MSIRIDSNNNNFQGFYHTDGAATATATATAKAPVSTVSENNGMANIQVSMTPIKALQRALSPDIASQLLKDKLQMQTQQTSAVTHDPALAATKMSFSEDMKGNFQFGDHDYRSAENYGKQNNQNISFHANMKIDNMDKFLNSPEHEARIEGYINYPPLGGKLAITEGKFNLFAIDPDTGARQMHYQIKFVGNDGQTYLLDGIKYVKDDPGMDIWSDNTTLYTKIYKGGTTDGPVVSTGVMHISLWDTLRLVQSMKINAPSLSAEAKAIAGFGKFFFGALWDECIAGKFTRLFRFLNL